MLKKGIDKASFKLIGAIGEQIEQSIGNQNTDNYVAQFASNDTDNSFKKEYFTFFNARHLSVGTVASGSWRSTTFSQEVLVKSLPLFNNLLVYLNHDLAADNCKGFCYAGSWDSGNDVRPAGINAIIALDKRKSMVNDILQTANYPIRNPLSMSVTVEYEYESSHDWSVLPQGTYWEYGMIAPDGKELTRNVTNIVRYYETSVVWEGADSNAKIYDEVAMPFAQNLEDYQNGNNNLFFEIETRKAQGSQIESFNNMTNNKEIIGANVDSLQVEIDSLKAEKESLNAQIATLQSENAKLTESLQANELKLKAGEKALKEEFATRILAEKQVDDFIANEAQLKSEFEASKSELESFKTKFTEIEQYTTQKRQSVIENYRKVKLGQENETELQEIENATLTQLEALNFKYVGDILTQFGAQCNECKSKDISIRSSLAGNAKEESDKKQNKDFFELI